MPKKDEGSPSYRRRIDELRKRGINPDLLKSEWCVSCIHSCRIVENLQYAKTVEDGMVGPEKQVIFGTCEMGCNGIPPFYTGPGGNRIFSQESTPLMYEEEILKERIDF